MAPKVASATAPQKKATRDDTSGREEKGVLYTSLGNKVPLGRDDDRDIVDKDITAELLETVGKSPITFLPLQRHAVDYLQQHYPLMRNRADLEKAPDLLKKSEFGFCPLFSPELISETAQCGLFPMSIDFGRNTFLFTPKCHKNRSISMLQNFAPIPGTRRIANKSLVCINRHDDYMPVAQMIYDQHGENWMCEALRRAFYHMFCNPEDQQTKIVCIAIRTKDIDPVTKEVTPGELVAGELGYVVGDIYTSLTGAYTMSGMGSLQLSMTGLVLQQLGLRVWDLGMNMKYKEVSLGCREVGRKRWLQLVQSRVTAEKEAGSVDPTSPTPAFTSSEIPTDEIRRAPFVASFDRLKPLGSVIECRTFFSPSSSDESGLAALSPSAGTKEGAEDKAAATKSQKKAAAKKEFLEAKKAGRIPKDYDPRRPLSEQLLPVPAEQ